MMCIASSSILSMQHNLSVLLPRACMCEGVKQSVLSICQFFCLFVSLSGEKFLNLNIDRVKRFPKLTESLTL